MKIQTKSKKVNKNWLNQHLNDPYVQAAQKDGYRARAAYKLKEIDETFKLIRPGQVVVDLGCAPGAWSQYLRRTMAPKGAAADGAHRGCALYPGGFPRRKYSRSAAGGTGGPQSRSGGFRHGAQPQRAQHHRRRAGSAP